VNNFNPIYKKFINDKNFVAPVEMVRAKFYQIKQYTYVDGQNGRFNETDAPIIYTLFVSKQKDVVHCVKVSNIKPYHVKRFFSKFVNEDTDMLEMRGNSKKYYSSVISKIPMITEEAYRTYKLSNIRKVIELDMEINEMLPKSKQVKGIDKKSQKQNK
jgi:hypothetical protein